MRNPQNLTDTTQLISYACDQALQDAQAHDQVTLDYSIASLKEVDEILGRAHEDYVKDPSSLSVRGISAEYGAYVGEVIRRSEPGTYWTRDSKGAGEKSYPLHWKGGECFPMAWCAKRIINGDEDSIWGKYTLLKDDSWRQQPSAGVGKPKEAQK